MIPVSDSRAHKELLSIVGMAIDLFRIGFLTIVGSCGSVLV